jgi:hypothetical protein
MSKRVIISPQVSVYVSDDMLEMLNFIANNSIISLNSTDEKQKKLLKQMLERNLLVRRRKNNEVSYSIRPGINWN